MIWYFFDLDGTITDPAEGIFNSIARALYAMNRTMLSEEICRRFIGPALMDSFTRYCNMTPDEGAPGHRALPRILRRARHV